MQAGFRSGEPQGGREHRKQGGRGHCGRTPTPGPWGAPLPQGHGRPSAASVQKEASCVCMWEVNASPPPSELIWAGGTAGAEAWR